MQLQCKNTSTYVTLLFPVAVFKKDKEIKESGEIKFNNVFYLTQYV